MGTVPRPQYSPPAPTDACRELAGHLRYMLEREGLTPRQLADAPDVPYSVGMLYRFLSGDELPPPLLIKIVARHCRTHPDALRTAYERARLASTAASGGRARRCGGRPRGRHAKVTPRRSDRTIRLTLGIGFSAAGAVVIGASVIHGLGDPSTVPSAPVRAAAPPAPATNAGGLLPPAEIQSPYARSEPKIAGRASEVPRQVIKNGRFSKNVAHWLTRDDTRIRLDGKRMRVNIRPTGGAARRLEPSVKQRIPALDLGDRYVLTLRAGADSKVTVQVTVQSDTEQRARALRENIVVTKRMRSYRVSFTSRLDLPDPVVGLQVVSDNDMHSLWLDDIAMTRIPAR